MNDAADWIAARADDITRALGPVCRPGAPYALLDWPAHSNVGDSAIWLGEIVWARAQLQRLPDYASTSRMAAEGLDRLCPTGTVFLHGGGNFGDIWPEINSRRIALLQSHRHRRIVQLPQSIHFDDRSELERMQRAIAGHPDFTLFLRDTASLDFARRHFDCETHLCPDMALMLGPLPRPAAPVADVFCLLRTDRERAASSAEAEALPLPGPAGDWVGREPKMETRADRLVQRLYARSLSMGAPAPVTRALMQRRIAVLNRHAEQRLQRGLALLAQGRQVLTDRLHAHLLCTLMGIPHVVLDNSYGKIRNFNTSWPPDGLTRTAADMAEARALLAAGAAAATPAAPA